MGKSIISKILLGILSLLRIGLATAIIIITAVHLYRVTIYSWGHDKVFAYSTTCLMAGKVSKGDVCEYTYAVCGLSLLLSLITSIFLCVTCDLCGVGLWLEFAVDAFQTAWWIIASIVISDRVKETNDKELPNGETVPNRNWRNAVAVMAWVTAMLCAISAIILFVECVKRLAECCGCCGLGKKDKEGKKDKKKSREEDAQQLHQQQPGQPGPYTPPQNDEAVRATAV